MSSDPRAYGRTVPVPSQEIAACAAAHQRLARTVLALPTDAFGAPSPARPAHLLTHLARNADGVPSRHA